jgi:uncharacterized protein (TIGR02453 family)
MPPSYFSPDLFEFLVKLKRNNRREWFQKNKATYELLIKEPSIRFISDFAQHLHEISPHLVADPRNSMFRIYRDIRFSADKKPYKTHVALQFNHRGNGKNVHAPGYYLHIEPGRCLMGAGSWHPDGPSLLKIREAIVARGDDWKKATKGWELAGESLSRPPRGFPNDHPLIEDLKRKDFLFVMDLSEKQICSPKFMGEFVSGCGKMAPLVAFLSKALSLKW